MIGSPDGIKVKALQDNYGRWFVEASAWGAKQAPIRCMTEREAMERALREQLRLAEKEPQPIAA